jgi:hypothetical protein
MLLCVQPALEDGKLKPFAISMHQPEYAAPAFYVSDVVCHDE